MSYYNDRERDRGGLHRGRHPRINEKDVPESKHTIFVRGLSGDLTTDEVKDYIEDRIGRVTFDFVKTSQDKSKLFVAVRFENREDAKDFMAEYSERDFMGYRCQLTWFRDIRRYCAYQQSKIQQQLPKKNSPRRRRRSDSDEEDGEHVERSRSRSKSRSRSRSESRSKRSYSSRSRSRSQVNQSPMDVSDESDDEKSKKHQKSARSDEEEDDDEDSEYEERPVKMRSSPAPPKPSSIPLPPNPEEQTVKSMFIPPPTVVPEETLMIKKPIVITKEFKINLKQEESPVLGAAALAIHNSRISMNLDNDTPPQVIIKSDPMATPSLPTSADSLPPPPPPPPQNGNNGEKKLENKWSCPMDIEPAAPQIRILSNFDEKPPLKLPETQKSFGHLADFQTKLLKSVVFEKREDEGGLRLSSCLHNEQDEEQEKALQRERRLATLDDDQMVRFVMKKKQLEAAYRGDCETYAYVTRALLSKDESLQVGLKVALLENMEDLYQKMLQRVDDFLESI